MTEPIPHEPSPEHDFSQRLANHEGKDLNLDQAKVEADADDLEAQGFAEEAAEVREIAERDRLLAQAEAALGEAARTNPDRLRTNRREMGLTDRVQDTLSDLRRASDQDKRAS